MRNTGIVDLPLHGGRCPRWLFPLMKELSGKISEVIIEEYGTNEFLKRISDPYWFQALGSAIGFDWHSSGLTTTTTAALKESINSLNLGVKVAGGKGKTSKKTPEEIEKFSQDLRISENKLKKLQKATRLTAKVDNSLIQDGYKLYHHSFFLTKNNWTVVQQGMNSSSYSRRYHWLSSRVKSFVNEPHTGVVSDEITSPLNLIANESKETRSCSVDLIKENPAHLKRYFSQKGQTNLFQFTKHYSMTSAHFPKITANMKTLINAYEIQPKNYEELALIRGMGSKNIRALALLSNLIHGTELSWKDPVKYSFTHGGKDGWPFPVDKETYNSSISFLRDAIKEAKINNKHKFKALRRLNNIHNKV